jgi:outer membrane protein assembly factor BamB
VLADGVWVYSEGQQLAVYDARTGSARWSTPLDCFTCEAAVGGGRVYAAGDGKVRAYDANDGRVVWTSRGVGGLDTISTVRLDGGTLYALASVGSPVSGYVVDAYRASDGTPLWHVSFGGGRGFDPLVRPAAAGGLFVYPAPDGYLYAVRDGHVAWKAGLGGAVDSTPAIGDGRVWIVDASGRLTAFSAADGRTLWAAPPVAGLSSSSPALGGGYVLVGTPSGHLIAYAPA